jgi:(hydroxyamino)benzene mutase
LEQNRARHLKFLGIILFLIGLITGTFLMKLLNPRMGLSAHLEGVMNGTFLVVAGLVWNDLVLSDRLKKITYWSLIYGTFVNWFMTFLSACLGTSKMTPIAGQGYLGTMLQESIVAVGLFSVAFSMLFAVGSLVYGLRGKV